MEKRPLTLVSQAGQLFRKYPTGQMKNDGDGALPTRSFRSAVAAGWLLACARSARSGKLDDGGRGQGASTRPRSLGACCRIGNGPLEGADQTSSAPWPDGPRAYLPQAKSSTDPRHWKTRRT